ncbi:ABC transporter permease [Oscillospiraceae bacterium OttesenSCG-928-G22]|nr:ABC transporter permease [Oscillospiraceae bacterium OttesenSCG-928-G22]
MTMVLQNYKNELTKLFAKKKYIVFLLIEIAICVTATLIQMAIARVMLESNLVAVPVNLSMLLLTFFIQAYIPLLIFMASADLFSAEIQDNTIKASLVRPQSRLKVFLSKTLAIATMAVFYLLFLFLTTTVLEAFSGGIQEFFFSFTSYLLDLVPLFVLVLMAVLFNQFTKNPTLAMFLTIIVYVALLIGGIFIPQLSGMLFTGYAQWHNLFLGEMLPPSAMLTKTGLLLGYGMIFFTAGYYLFERKDI